jgi:HEXXH motif-containing protein
MRFEAMLDGLATFRFGRYVLTNLRAFTFTSDGRVAELTSIGVPARTFTHIDGEWVGEGERLEVVGGTRGPVSILPSLPNGFDLPTNLVSANTHDGAREAYESAYALLATYAAPYRAWVDRVVHSLVPIGLPAGRLLSSSFVDIPSVVALSFGSLPINLADCLVHEASHQHFYALTQLGRVDDGTDTGLYYSPGPRTERPIDKILLAYHAFANILLFYRYARAHGFTDDGHTLRMERSCEDSVAQLTKPLESTRALTPIGRALFEPLATRLSSAHERPLEEGMHTTA